MMQPMAAMDSVQSQLHIQIPHLPQQTIGSLDPLDPLVSTPTSTTSSAPDFPLFSSPTSAFDFTWIPESHGTASPTISGPPSTSHCSLTSSPACGYSFNTRQRHNTAGRSAASSSSSRATNASLSPSFSPSTFSSSAVPPLSLRDSIAGSAVVRPLSAWLDTSPSSSPTGAYTVSTAASSPTSISPRTTKPPATMRRRPAKRSADGGGTSDEDATASSSGKAKIARSDRGPEDFSTVVKNRLQSYSRTGQACDRCKVRKIRCDALPEGCSHCINLNLECYVTDRVTGRTERRGYMQQLEREKNSMISHIRDLERLCADKGVEVKPWEQGPASVRSSSEAANSETPDANEAATSTETWSRYGSLYIRDNSLPKATSAVLGPKIQRNGWQTRPEETQWGVVGDEAPLSSLKGTTLTLLGTTIETTSFDAPDVDEPPSGIDPSMPLYNKSVQAFLRSCMGVNPAVQVDLPNRENAFMYAEWYFISIASFMPVLHKPTFMKLLARVYDEPGFKPSVSELVQVHMVFAHILFQFGVRNSQTLEQRNNFNDLSNKHYHFALSKLYDILSSQSFEALQGLVLIASHTRAFPKPGCGSIVASMALHRALELNLHRRTKKPGEPTSLQNELRKRAFWCIMTVVVAINGKRGYPIPISVQDFDVDFPAPIADELLSEEGADTSRTLPCPYEVAICGFKMIPIMMAMYTNVFSVRRDQDNYKNILTALEAEIEDWEANLPESLRLNAAKTHDHEMVGPLFARTFVLELRLHIRHPSLAMTNDKDLIIENTRVCEEAASEYLETVEHLSRMKALDTTWYQMSIYCVAILSMLVPQWERRSDITPKEVTKLRDEMDRWMNIVKEMSSLLGCGTGTSTQIAELVNRTMAWIERDMGPKNCQISSQPEPSTTQEQQQQMQSSSLPQSLPEQAHLNQASSYPQESTVPPFNSSQMNAAPKTYYETDKSSTSQGAYPPLSYVDNHVQRNTSLQSVPFQHEQQALFYPANSSVELPAVPSSSDPLVTYGQPQGHQHPDFMWRTSWQNWTAAIADSQPRYNADSLLPLGGGNASRNAVVAPIMNDNGLSHMSHTGGELPMIPQPAQWPLLMFDQTPQE